MMRSYLPEDFGQIKFAHMDYVLWLLEYYIRNEGLVVKEMNEGGGDSEKETT